MKKSIFSSTLAVLLGVACFYGASGASAEAPADTETLVKSADLPEIDEMKPFSAEANYSSLAGRLRYLTFEHSGVWLSRDESALALGSLVETAER